ncbi:hypothetical protein BCR41DRAFT_360003 [Lobosporangium transversale]|uniref:Uncharacterized protein n=1 Tax=Lobosporangium transversale TaxID=64571 RepID=A0A1Y2GEL6_9FUNG|nr:hypothetical protein BCR41DRAFT_360003 [Lobosporangium transversale]ORZ07756.1 hypothetical protein BCR41DRAFT_360003 [Lobosporangium transversale]|eukprot:XP_021878122.1 hypothetical protein BCR41DRAFT_360003 [Lobosporangium transversale]
MVAPHKVLKFPKYCFVMFLCGALSRPLADIDTFSFWHSELDLPSSLSTFVFSRARVMTPQIRETNASPVEIHISPEAGEKSLFNCSSELLVNFHRETNDGWKRNGQTLAS